jgi:N6-L-threonylcarbamoyladenine synthase
VLVLGIETSCDECSISLVEDGWRIISNVVASQIDNHRIYDGVVPEIASRLHTEWISSVFRQAIEEAGITKEDIDAVAVTNRPGLVGSLIPGLSFAKALAWGLAIPYVAVDHIRAHLYAPNLNRKGADSITYPALGLLISGGHTVICRMGGWNEIEVMGTTIDDACGEAFDKVAKFYHLGYPGGVAIDRLSQSGDENAFTFPDASLHKGDHRYDVSYSGLKTAVINQLDQFSRVEKPYKKEDIAASFQKAAIGTLMKRLKRALKTTGIGVLAVGGGVAANTLLRKELSLLEGVEVVIPPMQLCTDNGAMVAGLGYKLLRSGERSGLDENALSRVAAFRKRYP